MCNKKLLTAKMLLAGRTAFVKNLSSDLHISTGSASGKLNNNIPFRQDEMALIAKMYHLTPSEFIKVFFPNVWRDTT